MLGTSRTTVSAVVADLLEEGVVEVVGQGEASRAGGRRPVQLRFVPTSRFVVGADIGGTKTLLLLLDLDGNVIARTKYPTREGDRSPLDNLVRRVDQLIKDAGVDRERVVGTGVGVPTMVDFNDAVILQSQFLGMNGESLRDALANRLPGIIYADNDVNMAALGEYWKGKAVGMQNAVLITIGTNIGAGIIMNGQLYRGQGGAAGEIGLINIDPDASAQTSWHRGPLESAASGNGITRVAQARFDEFPETTMSREDLSSEALFRAESEGDPLAVSVITDAYKHLAFAISNIIALMAPEIVIIGGGVAQVGERYVDELRHRVAAHCVVPHRIELATLGEDAGACGAAATVLRETGNLSLMTEPTTDDLLNSLSSVAI